MTGMLRFGAAFVALAMAGAADAREVLPAITVEADRPGVSLTVPSVAEALRDIRLTPGAVNIVADGDFRNRRAATIKDVLDYVPGVFAQPKWGEDTRLSIRGSGLSRNFHLRGVQLYMDGIPVNTADGYGDFQEIDPSAYRFVEVFKGANALRFGANAHGGAINFVTLSGHDAERLAASLDLGSFGFRRLQSSAAGVFGPADFFITGALQEQDGFRAHSWGRSARTSANFGYRFSGNAETRFYLNANDIMQRIPGAVSRQTALTSPRTAAPLNIANDWQRNIQSLRIANKTTLRFDDTTVEFGAFGTTRHLEHPIFQWLDYRYADYGGFARAINDTTIYGYRNRFVAGINLHNGTNDARQYANGPNAAKGALLSRSRDRADNLSIYAENSFYFLPDIALVGGIQYLFAVRDRTGIVNLASGRTEHSLFSPKAGLLWNVDAGWQVFANVSRSAEAPSFGEGTQLIPFTQIRPQRATTYEIGTRGRRPDFTWDVAIYRAEIRDELLCLFSAFGNCNVTNADRTVHQGLELGVGVTILRAMFERGSDPDRLWLNLAYTFNDFRFDNDAAFGDNELPGAPRHLLRAELLYKHPRGFYFGPNLEWVPRAYFVDSANTFAGKGYAIWGLRAGYEEGRFSAFIDARNLGNRAYIASASITNVYNPAFPNLFEPGNGRAVYGGIRIRW